jgi:phosphonate transport system permease protein
MTDAAAAFEKSWAATTARRRFQRAAYLVVFAALLVLAATISEFSPQRLIEGWPRTAGFFERALPDIKPSVAFAGEKTEGSFLYWFYAPEIWAAQLWTSIEMGILATILGAVGGFSLAFLAARNLTPNRGLGFAIRRLLELVRTIPELVTALIFVFAFGIGPPAGVLAIALHTTGALGKLFSEALENIDMRPLDAIRGAGGDWFTVMRYAVVPQVLSSFASYSLLRFEINVGAAAAIGFVGAGGIGQELQAAMGLGQFRDASAIIFMVIVTIFLIDLSSERIRHRLIGLTGSA